MNWLTTNYNCEDYPKRERGYNNILSVQVITDVTAEPVTLAEIKMHTRVDFTDDDSYLAHINKVAREQIENEYNVSLAPKTLKVKVKNDLGNLTLPFGPVASITSVTQADGTAIEAGSYSITDGEVRTSFYTDSFIQYVTGYVLIPANYKQMILERAAYLYNTRGDEKKTRGGAWLI